MWKTSLSLLIFSWLSGGCGSPQGVASAPRQGALHAAYQSMFGGTLAQQAARLAAARRLAVTPYIDGLLAGTADATVLFDRISVPNLHSHLASIAPVYKYLARSYPTLGTLWDAFGTQPVTWISEDAFVNALRRAADAWEGAAPAAPLALGDIRPINYLEPPPSGCTAEISYAPSFAAGAGGRGVLNVEAAPNDASHLQPLSGIVPLSPVITEGAAVIKNLEAMFASGEITQAPQPTAALPAAALSRVGNVYLTRGRVNTPEGSQAVYSLYYGYRPNAASRYQLTLPAGGGPLMASSDPSGLSDYLTRAAMGCGQNEND